MRLHEPKKMFALQEEIQQQIGADNNLWMNYRLALYRSRAYLLKQEIQASVKAARESFRDVLDWKSPHRIGQAHTFLVEIENAGYGDVQAVKDFREELLFTHV